MSPKIEAPKIRVKEAAARLGKAEYTIKQWVRDGKLGCYRLGRHITFSEENLASFIAASERPRTAVAA